jgi:photosystem II stability/assembly factor-like uncharacterized protein
MLYRIFAASIIFMSCNLYSQWTVLSSGTGSNLKTVFFINSAMGFAGGSAGTMLKTTNGGINWQPLTSGLSVDINSIHFYNSNTGLACANGGTIIMTTSAGTMWSPIPSGVTANLHSISFFDNNAGVCTGSNGTLMFSTNGGINWTVAEDGFLSTYYGIHMVTSTIAYAGGVNTIFQPLVAKTTNGGANWTHSVFYLNGNEGNIRDMYFLSATEGFAVSNVWDGQGGISHTLSGGISWGTQLIPKFLNSVDFPTQFIGYAVGGDGFVTKSTNRGFSWTTQQSSTSALLRAVDFTDSLTGYAVGDGGVIIKTTNGGLTPVISISSEIPKDYSLYQNYPNPFNPMTNIKFNIPNSGFVQVKVFDILGSETAQLVNEELLPRVYEVKWDASAYPSGVYYYRLVSGEFSETKKMILIK